MVAFSTLHILRRSTYIFVFNTTFQKSELATLTYGHIMLVVISRVTLIVSLKTSMSAVDTLVLWFILRRVF